MRTAALLSRQQLFGRFFGICAVVTSLWLWRSVDPVALGRWLPFHTSCGAITGLPCVFCGFTRGMHFLLNGQFDRALYFNWLVFPFLGSALILIPLFAFELTQRRAVLKLDLIGNITTVRLTIVILTLAALWVIQVYLALSQHKSELLNPNGPLYSLFVR